MSLVKDITSLKHLSLVDLSYNKIIEFDKIKPLQNLKKLKVLSLEGNPLAKK